MTSIPLVSVIMATRNRALFLRESIGSILSQSYANLEFLIVDDASLDETAQILKEYAAQDARIRLFGNQTNLGLTKSLNKALREAKGKYIARLDDKDTAHKKRIQLQVEFLEANPSYALLGTWAYEMNKEGTVVNKRNLPTESFQLKRVLIQYNPFVHSSLMIRKEALERVGLYNEEWKRSQDYELYFRIAKFYDIANLSEYLTTYRFVSDSITRTRNREQALFALKARQKALREGLYPKSLWAFLGIVRGYVSCLVPVSLRRRVRGMGYRSKGVDSREEQAHMLKICHVASVDISLRFLLLDLMRKLKEKGHEVHGVCSEGTWVKEIRAEGIPVHTVTITRRLFTPLADLLALWQLFWLFRRERFDIVHTHTPKACFLGQLAAFLARVPVRVLTIHGLYFQRESSWLKKLFFVPVEKLIATMAHLAFSVTREDVDLLLQWHIYPREKILYLGGGVDIKKLHPKALSLEGIARKKEKLGIAGFSHVIGIVARQVREKGFLPLFAAFQKVLSQFPGALLLVIGPEEPGKKDALDPKDIFLFGIGKSVVFLGERTDMPELYALMDLFVLPSFREGLGLSLVEASAMGKPVVASDIRGCREVVEQGVTGLLVPSNDSEKLAEALLYMLSHPQEAQRMGKEGRKKIELQYDQKIVFQRIEQAYERLQV